MIMNNNLTPNSKAKGAVGIGVTLLVFFRMLGELASCSKPAQYVDDIARLGSHADDLGRFGSYADDLGRTGTYGDDIGKLGTYGDDIQRYDDIFRIIPLIDKGDDTQSTIRNLMFMQDYVEGFHVEGNWLPLVETEHISKLKISDIAYSPSTSKNYGVLSVIPDNETSFQNIFKSSFSVSAQKEMENYKRLFSALDGSQILSADNIDEAYFLSLIKEKQGSSPLIIVGHSEEINALPNTQ